MLYVFVVSAYRKAHGEGDTHFNQLCSKCQGYCVGRHRMRRLMRLRSIRETFISRSDLDWYSHESLSW